LQGGLGIGGGGGAEDIVLCEEGRGGGELLDELLQGLVVDEAGGVLGDLELALLDLLAKLPGQAVRSVEVS
jgi:hypothetical protein